MTLEEIKKKYKLVKDVESAKVWLYSKEEPDKLVGYVTGEELLKAMSIKAPELSIVRKI